MTLSRQIEGWFQAGEHQQIVQAILALPGAQCTDELLGELAVAYNNLGEYERAILVLKELENHFRYTASWQYRMGYALYYSAVKTPDPSKQKRLLLKACLAFLTSLTLKPKEPVRKDCLEFLSWIQEDLKILEN